jgi:hypothetical protein
MMQSLQEVKALFARARLWAKSLGLCGAMSRDHSTESFARSMCCVVVGDTVIL